MLLSRAQFGCGPGNCNIHSPTHAVMPHKNLESIDWKGFLILESSLPRHWKAINACIDWYLQQWPFSLICTDPVFLWRSFCWQRLGLSEMLCWHSKARFTWVSSWMNRYPMAQNDSCHAGKTGHYDGFWNRLSCEQWTVPYNAEVRQKLKSSQESFNFSLCVSLFSVSPLFSKTWFSPVFSNWIATAQRGWHIPMR